MTYYKVLIDAAKCDGCGRCVEACPVHILIVREGKAVLKADPDECLGCEFCVEACPLGCINVKVRATEADMALSRGG